MEILLDTNIWVHAVKNTPLWEQVKKDHFKETNVITSVVVKAEMLSLAKKWNWGLKKELLVINKLNEARLVEMTPGLIPFYVEIDLFSTSVGRIMGKNDLWIAALAMYEGATLITADKDFNHLGGTKINLIEYDTDNLTHSAKTKE